MKYSPRSEIRTSETVDILLDVTNPGLWMAHCHIAKLARQAAASFPAHARAGYPPPSSNLSRCGLESPRLRAGESVRVPRARTRGRLPPLRTRSPKWGLSAGASSANEATRLGRPVRSDLLPVHSVAGRDGASELGQFRRAQPHLDHRIKRASTRLAANWVRPRWRKRCGPAGALSRKATN